MVLLKKGRGNMAPHVHYNMRYMRTRTKNLKNEKSARILLYYVPVCIIPRPLVQKPNIPGSSENPDIQIRTTQIQAPAKRVRVRIN